MKGLEELLGFRITGSPDSCIDHRRVEILTADGESVKAVRPATHQEIDLWQALVGTEAGMNEAAGTLREALDTNAQLLADNQSLKQSCNAYQDELEKLRLLAEKNWVSPALPPRTVSTLDMFAEIVQSHKAQKKRLLDKAREIWQIEPGTDIIDFVFRQLQHLNGEMAVKTEQRRQEYTNRVAGRPVRDNPQA